jgi:Zinc finger, C3HC4 type (RING finger)
MIHSYIDIILRVLLFISIPNLISSTSLQSTRLNTNGTNELFTYDKSLAQYVYFYIPTPDLSNPIVIIMQITSKTLPNVLELYEGNENIIFPNSSTKSDKTVLILLEHNGTAFIELHSFKQENIYFGLKAKYNGNINIIVSFSEMEKTPFWKTIIYVIAGLISTGLLIWLCVVLMKHINNCCDKISDCIEDSCFYIGSKLRRPCKKRPRENVVIPHEGAPRIILVASMPDPGRFRFENRIIPVLVDKLDKMKETLADENNVVGIPEEFVCSVCMVRRKTMMFDPCKHICCCSSCSREIIILQKKCPLCREPINDIQIAA